ncbi:hypothetical protein H4582DRAFT_1231718 [Lactarius indigo]|nr:hypothetical protein H4582DRAFT_1231718 [Lactarius indigo]
MWSLLIVLDAACSSRSVAALWVIEFLSSWLLGDHAFWRAHGNIGHLLILQPPILMASAIDICRHNGTGRIW